MEKLLILFSSLLFLQANASISSELLARTNSSNLCSRIPSQSCLSQLRSEKLEGSNNRGLETCQVEVANNTNLRGTCNNQLWEHRETCQSYDGCGVHLEVYRHMTHPSVQLFRTAFNLSLTNITSREVKLRYSDILTGNFTFCINFTTTSSAANPIESLWYDCVFHYRKHESHPFQLEFLSDNQYGLLLFQIPAEKDLKNGHGFLYVHVHHSPMLVITFQETIPLQPNSVYSVTVCRWLQDNCHVVLSQDVDLKNSSTYAHRFRDLVTLSLGKVLYAGNFSIQIKESNCSSQLCYQATSSFFVIPEIDRNYFFYLPILGVLALAALCVTINYRMKIKTLLAGGADNRAVRRRQTILLVHDPAASDYCWVESVQMFLQRWGAFDVWLDFIDIPQSPHKDPLIWYSEAMEAADVVAVIAPTADTRAFLEQRSAIYHHTFDLALELVATRISRRLKLQEQGFMKRLVVLETRNSLIPDICSSFVRFRVPEQLHKLIRYIANNNGTAADSRKRCDLPDCLLACCEEDSDSSAIDSFHLIHQHLGQRNKSVQVRDYQAKHVSECSSLLAENEDRDRRRQQLDREFGSAIISVNALPNLG